MKALISLKNIALFTIIGLVSACASNQTSDTSPNQNNNASNEVSDTEYSDVTAVDISSDTSDSSRPSNNDQSIIEMPSASTVYYFAFDRSLLTAEAKQALRAHAVYLKSSNRDAVIEGHADERGSREYNIALGEQRAKSIKSFLVSEGVSANNLEVVSYGEEKPISRANNELAWSTNRRGVLAYR